jgi:hypothetical protein
MFTLMPGQAFAPTLDEFPQKAETVVTACGLLPSELELVGAIEGFEVAAVDVQYLEPVVEVPGGAQITAVGDSLMVGATPYLEGLLPGISIDAEVGRALPAGMDILDTQNEHGEVREFVVLGLATNAGVRLEQYDEIVNHIGTDRALILVNAWGDRTWIPGGNEQVAAAAAQYPNLITIADWHGLIAEHPEFMGPDGIHPTEAGKAAYANLIVETLAKAAHA